jgi:ribosome-binding factor A
MKESKRQRQFSSLIQKELSEIFQREARWMFESNVFVTVTDVSMSADLGVAKVFLSFMLSQNKQELIELVQLKKSEIRKLLGNRIGKVVRTIPELIFNLDESADYASRIEGILAGLDIPPAENEEEDDKN